MLVNSVLPIARRLARLLRCLLVCWTIERAIASMLALAGFARLHAAAQLLASIFGHLDNKVFQSIRCWPEFHAPLDAAASSLTARHASMLCRLDVSDVWLPAACLNAFAWTLAPLDTFVHFDSSRFASAHFWDACLLRPSLAWIV